jgi:hypothetical protein
MERVVVLGTSDIHQTWPDRVDHTMIVEDHEAGVKFYSRDQLETLLKAGEKVVVITTRTELKPTDDWWLALVGRDNVFLAPVNGTGYLGVDNPALLVPWRKLFERVGVAWPDTVSDWLSLRDSVGEVTGGKIVYGAQVLADTTMP